MKIDILKDNRHRSILLMIIVAILWSTSGIVIKLIQWHPIAISGSRSLVASLTILLYLKRPRFTMSKPQLLGAFFYASNVTMFVMANKLTTAANAVLLRYTSPIFVAILAIWILKEKMRWYDWVTIGFVLGGMLLFFVDKTVIGGMLGNILALLSGFGLACVTISIRLQKDGSALETILLGDILTFIIAIPFIFQSIPDMRSIIGIVFLGTFQIGTSYILYTTAIKHLSAIEAILITVLEPLLNPIWVFFILGEKPSSYAILGGIVVITSVLSRGIYVNNRLNKKNSIET